MGDLFDAAAMYDEDYLYFFAAPGEPSEFAVLGPVVPGAGLPCEAAARGLHLLHARLVPQLVPGRLAARLPWHAHAMTWTHV